MKHQNLITTTLVIVILAGAIFFGNRFIAIHSQANDSQTTVARSAYTDNDTDESAENPEIYTAAVAQALLAPKVEYRVSSSTPQFVLLSFDGSKSVDMLNETLAFEQKMQTEQKPLHFTYFINAAYFLTQDNSDLYKAPDQATGTSNIGWSSSAQDIPLRVAAFNTAFAEGNDIGSHSAGHFDGSAWTYDEWNQEFNSFTSLMANVQQNNPSQKIDTPTFLTGINGFRAPNLGVNSNLYKVLGDLHFAYDGSGVSAIDAWPSKDSYGVWHIPLSTVFLGANIHPVIAMDYNEWMRQSNVQEIAVKGTPLWTSYFNEVETAYMNLFNTHYNGNRGPVVIGDHFSKWNDGVYWEAMKTLAENVCGMPNVRCGTFKDLVAYMNSGAAPVVVK